MAAKPYESVMQESWLAFQSALTVAVMALDNVKMAVA
jgi:hypothetical protein